MWGQHSELQHDSRDVNEDYTTYYMTIVCSEENSELACQTKRQRFACILHGNRGEKETYLPKKNGTYSA